MLLESGLTKILWAEAINTAVFVLNRSGPSRINNKTPYELWWGKEYDIHTLQVFGSKVAVHVPDQKRLKFDSKAEIGYFIGYGENTKGYRVYFPEKNKVEIKRDIIFIKELKENKEAVKERYVRQDILTGLDIQQEIQHTCERENNICTENETLETEETHMEETINDKIQPEECEESEIERYETPTENSEEREEEEYKRPKRQTRKPKWMQDYIEGEEPENTFISYSNDEPNTYQEALKRLDRCMWEQAVEKELQTLKENNTWEEVDEVPDGENIISSKWVFKIKEAEGKKIYKARLVARGFEQKNCDDYTYAPVAKLTTFRTLMAVATQKKQQVYQMDVTGAFLYGDIKETVYMRLPNNKVCKLNKSIYGLKKSPRYWNTKFNDFMVKENFERSKNDPCLYFKRTDGNYIYVLLFVDDLLYFGNNEALVNDFKNALCKNFQMKDLGLASTYLGININQNLKNCVTTINQKDYILKLLDKYQMSNCKTVETPIEQNFNFEVLKKEKSESPEIEKECRSLVGSLLYVTCTRPDLSVVVGFLSRYVHCASSALFKCLKRILRYLKGSVDLSLTYKCENQNPKLLGYSDADWAGDVTDRKSTSGYIFYVFNCPISWGTKKQTCVSLSSCEAEYLALCMTIMEGSFLNRLLSDFEYKDIKFEILEDNQSVIKIAENNDSNKRLKHVDIKYQYIVEKVSEGFVNIQYISSNNNVADAFTKPLGKQAFLKFRNKFLE